MPDLNFENPAVTEAMFAGVQFWMEEMGVDGFRLDAIKHMVEEGSIQENSFATHDWLEDFYTFYKVVNPNAFTVGEAWTSTQQVVDYTGDEVDVAFQFDLAEDVLNGVNAGIPSIYHKTFQEVYDSFPPNQYATFITNHDQNRVMSQLQGDDMKAKLAASVLLTAPGVPFIYYGEEIGMTGVKPDEDIRLPMQWESNSPRVGFTDGTPWRAAALDFPERSVARQADDANSLLNHYRSLIQLRNAHEALRVGDFTLVEANSNRLYTFLRHTENETILVIINFNRNPVTAEDYNLEMVEGLLEPGMTATPLYGLEPENTIEAEGFRPFAEIPAQSTHILQLVADN
jgi:glycosidase